MSLDSGILLEAIVSHAAASGHFERVNKHEPKNAPGNGLTAAAWVQRIDPVRTSGLKSTSARVVFTVRIFSNMLQEPQDEIDPNITAAVDALMNAYSGDFSLDGLARNVDLLGQHGVALSAQAGYVPIGNPPKLYRIMDISVPVIVNDVWTQVR